MNKICLAALICALLLPNLPGQPAAASAAATSTAPGSILTVRSSDADLIEVQFEAPLREVLQREAGGQPCQEIRLGNQAGWLEADPGGFPAASLLLAIPDSADVQLTVLDQQLETQKWSGTLCPPERLAAPLLLDPGTLPADLPAPASPAPQTALDQPLVTIAQQGYLREQPFIELRVAPVQIDPVSMQITITRKMTVRVTLNSPAYTSAAGPVLPSIVTREQAALQTLLPNFDAASNSPALAALPGLHSQPAGGNLPVYQLTVAETGIVRLTYDMLLEAGLPLASIDPSKLHLLLRETEIPIEISGEADGRFDPQDALTFFAEPVPDRYSDTAVYRLFWDDTASLRTVSIDQAPVGENPPPEAAWHWHKSHFEVDAVYLNTTSSGPANDHWFWNFVNASGKPASLSLPFLVEQIASTSGEQPRFTALLRSYTGVPRHHTRVLVNGVPVADTYWDPGGDLWIDVPIPLGVLLEGANTVTFEAPADGGISTDLIFINWFAVAYPRTFQAANNRLIFTAGPGEQTYRVTGFTTPEIEVYDITDPLAPVRVTGGVVEPDGSAFSMVFEPPAAGVSRRYLVQAAAVRVEPLSIIPARSGQHLRSASSGADYIVITPDEFLPAASDLASYRAGQGLREKVVTLQEVYDQFAYGYPQPEAIQAFLAFAYTNWQPPAPLYVVLLGDGHYDYKNLLQRNEPNWMPPLLADVDPWIGETAVDNRFAAVHGADNLPDLYIGRLPAKSLAQATAMVQKIQQYEAAPAADWNRRALFVADNTDSGGNFAASNDHLAAMLPPSSTVTNLNFISTSVTPVSAFRTAVQAEINAGKGMLLYSGHGSQQFWAQEGLFQRSYIPNLTPTGMYPFMISLTCMDGYFISNSTASSEISSLAEGMVRAADRGAIAAFSPAGYGVVDGHEILAAGLFDALYRHGLNRAGAAAAYAKYYLAANTAAHRDLIDTYMLFGDPALQLKLVPDQQPGSADLSLQLRQVGSASKPGEWVDVQLDYTNLGAIPAEGISIQLPVPAELLSPSVTTAPVLAQHAGAPYTFLLPVLNPGHRGRITLRAQIDPANQGIFLLQAGIASASPDADTTNNSAALALGEAPPTDLSVQVSLLPGSGLYGNGWADIVVTYANLGAQATGVSLSLPLSEPFDQPAFTLPAGWSEQSGTPLTWSITSLPAGAQGQISGRVQIDSRAVGDHALTAAITSYTPDSDPTNNQFTLPVFLRYRYFMPVVQESR